MMQVQMTKFECVYTSLQLNIAGVRQGPGKTLLGSCKVVEIVVTKRVGTLYSFFSLGLHLAIAVMQPENWREETVIVTVTLTEKL